MSNKVSLERAHLFISIRLSYLIQIAILEITKGKYDNNT